MLPGFSKNCWTVRGATDGAFDGDFTISSCGRSRNSAEPAAMSGKHRTFPPRPSQRPVVPAKQASVLKGANPRASRQINRVVAGLAGNSGNGGLSLAIQDHVAAGTE